MAAKRTQDTSPFDFGTEEGAASNTTTSVVGGKASRGADPFGVAGDAGASDTSDGSLFAAPEKTDDPGTGIGYRKRLVKRKNEVSVYTAQMDARHATDRRKTILLTSAVLMVVLIPLLVVMPIGLFGSGAPAVTPAYLIESIGSNITGFANWVSGGPVTSGVSILFWQSVAVALVGATLAINGCIFQGALKNALASPSTLGVISGGTLGTVLYALLFGVPETATVFTVIQASDLREQLDSLDLPSYLFATQGRALCSLAGCFIVVGLVLLVAHIAGRGKVSKVGLLIAGQVFAAVIAGVITVIRSYIIHFGSIEQQQALLSIVGGSISRITGLESLLIMGVPLLIGIVVIMALRFRLNLLAFNDEEAKAMGIKTTSTRNAVIIICTVLTGVVVSFVGSVGFVGFLIPHLARKVIGPDFRYLVPASALFGAIFLLLVNYVTNLTTLFAGNVGVLTSIIGAVAFLVIVIRERARGNVDWI